MPNYGHLSLSCYIFERPSPLEKPPCKVRLFTQIYFHEYRQKVTATMLFQTASHPVFQLLAQMAHVCLHSESGYTLAFQRKIAHSGSHGETRGISDGGGITTLGAFHTVRKPCVAGYQNGKLCPFWVSVEGTPEERREPAGQRCAYARRCPAGVAAPLGCVIFLLLSKLRLVHPALRAFPRVRDEGWYHHSWCALRVAETPDGRLSKRLFCRFLRLGSLH